MKMPHLTADQKETLEKLIQEHLNKDRKNRVNLHDIVNFNAVSDKEHRAYARI